MDVPPKLSEQRYGRNRSSGPRTGYPVSSTAIVRGRRCAEGLRAAYPESRGGVFRYPQREIRSTLVDSPSVVFGSSTDTVFGVFLAFLMVAGYVGLWALWHFVFRKAPPDERRQDDPPQSDQP